MKTVQYFTDDYLKLCEQFSTAEILDFLENFRLLNGKTLTKASSSSQSKKSSKSILISLKVQPELLVAFKAKAQLLGVPYQTMIKQLMSDWVLSEGSSPRKRR